MTCLEARVFPPALAASEERPAALPPPLSAALRRIDVQLDMLISHTMPLRKVS